MQQSIVLEPPTLGTSDFITSVLRDARRARRGRAQRDPDEPVQIRAGRMLERLLSRRSAGMVDLGRLLARHGTLQQLATPRIAGMLTSCDRISMPGWSALPLLVAVSELVHVVGTATSRTTELNLYVAAEWDGSDLVLALASRCRYAAPVPSLDGSRALRRATSLVGALGGDLVRGIEDGGMLFGLTFGWRQSVVDDSLPF